MDAQSMLRRRSLALGLLGLVIVTVAGAQTPPPTDPLDEIVVLGVRRSVESGQAVKRDALQVTDSIVAMWRLGTTSRCTGAQGWMS